MWIDPDLFAAAPESKVRALGATDASMRMRSCRCCWNSSRSFFCRCAHYKCFAQSLCKLAFTSLPVPNYTTLRHTDADGRATGTTPKDSLHLVLDSTGPSSMAKASGRCASMAGPSVALGDGPEHRTDLRCTDESSPGFRETVLFESSRLGDVLKLPIVSLLGFRRRDVADRAEQPTIVEPVDPFKRCQVDSLMPAPRAAPMNQLCFIQPVDCLGQCVVVRIANRAD
ncbi:hypothetical protein QFZ97_006466 [Paraburkholderia youngii]